VLEKFVFKVVREQRSPKIFFRTTFISLLLASLLFLGSKGTVLAGSNYKFVTDGEEVLKQGAHVIDARPLQQCLKQSVRDARCLPVADFFGPHGRLASFENINWLLGTVGLIGQEHILVVGDKAEERDFIAGVLFVVGQKEISVLTRQMSRGGGFSDNSLGSGVERMETRTNVYHGIARDKAVIFKNELARILDFNIPTVLIDGRSEREFWGASVRGFRGGHIVGARHLSSGRLRSLATSGEVTELEKHDTIIYGHNAFEGLAMLTLLRAGFNIEARVYPGGWAEWSADSNMPVDAVTYPDRGMETKFPQVTNPTEHNWILFGMAFLIGMAFATLFFFLIQRWGQK
jgi:thiosulfate/3-mercaptopyruvate sulfurtransferase